MTVERRTTPRVIGHASELGVGNHQCARCNEVLKNKVAWLELDQRTNTYHDFGGVPEAKSQGWFPFGLACARTELKNAIAKSES